MSDDPHQDTVRKAVLPEVMLAADIAVAIGLSECDARTAARRGLLGPPLLIRGEPAVLRDDFLESLARRAASDDLPGKELLPW